MKYFGATHRGKVRENNEDSFHAENDLFIVADGMGGHNAGEIASRLSIEYFIKFFKESTKNKKGFSSNQIGKILKGSIIAANDKVFRESVSNSDCFGMGTTFIACYLAPGSAHIIHVGDSRVYFIGKGGGDIKLVTSDHTFVGEMFRRGEITYEETFEHPQRNYLTNVLGVSDEIIPDYHILKVIEGDRLIMCTDGLNSMLRDGFILKISKKFREPEGLVKGLIKQANKLGGKDNTTVIVIDI